MTTNTSVAPRYWLQARPKTYDQVHHGLQWAFGSASQHPCTGCGEQAKDWAYQYSAGEKEMLSPEGSPYSDDLLHYAPMCRSCHRSFDIRNDPRRHVSVAFQRGGQQAIKALIAADPSWTAHRASNMRKLNGLKQKCGGCDLETNPGALSAHRRATGHSS